MADSIPCPADRIPRRNLVHHIVNFVSSLERVSLPLAADEHDRTCPICFELYIAKYAESDSEIALRLPCSHTIDSNCLMYCLNKTPTSGCPFCRQPLMTLVENRSEDIIRYLLFLLKHYHYPMAKKMLATLDQYGYYILATEISAAKIEHPVGVAKIAQLRREQAEYKAHWEHRNSLHYPLEFETKMDARRSGTPGENWIQLCTIQAVAWVIVHQMSEEALIGFGNAYVNKADLIRYLDDELYGPNGEGDMVHIYGIEKRRSWPEVRDMWDMKVNRWSFDFPTQDPKPWDLPQGTVDTLWASYN